MSEWVNEWTKCKNKYKIIKSKNNKSSMNTWIWNYFNLLITFNRNRSRDGQYLLLNILDELSKLSYIIRSSSTYFDEEVKCTITVALLQKKIGLEFS